MSMLHYNPQRADPARLEALTTGADRLALLDELIRTVDNERGRTSHQHQLLIGPRGVGKTHLLSVVAHRVTTTPTLANAYLPIVLPEEVPLKSPGELLWKLTLQLGRILEEAPLPGAPRARALCLELDQQARSITSVSDLLALSSEALRMASGELNRTLLAIVENLDALLYGGVGQTRSRAIEDQWALRKHLQTGSHLLLFAAAPTFFGGISDQDAPFFDFFRVHTLSELPLEEVLELIERRLNDEVSYPSRDLERAKRVQSLCAGFASRRPELAGIVTLTGGLPRFVHLVYDLLVESDLEEAKEVLESFLDRQTPYFQSRLDPRQLAQSEIDLLGALAHADGPLSPSALARLLRATTPSEVSVALERLRDKGLVVRKGKVGKQVPWDLAEPLYRVWTHFRESGEAENHLLVLAAIVAAVFEDTVLIEERRQLEELARDGAAHARFRLALVAKALEIRKRKDEILQGLEKGLKELVGALSAPDTRRTADVILKSISFVQGLAPEAAQELETLKLLIGFCFALVADDTKLADDRINSLRNGTGGGDSRGAVGAAHLADAFKALRDQDLGAFEVHVTSSLDAFDKSGADPAWAAMALLLRGMIRHVSARQDTALEAFQAVLELDMDLDEVLPLRATAHWGAARCLIALKRDDDAAAEIQATIRDFMEIARVAKYVIGLLDGLLPTEIRGDLEAKYEGAELRSLAPLLDLFDLKTAPEVGHRLHRELAWTLVRRGSWAEASSEFVAAARASGPEWSGHFQASLAWFMVGMAERADGDGLRRFAGDLKGSGNRQFIGAYVLAAVECIAFFSSDKASRLLTNLAAAVSDNDRASVLRVFNASLRGKDEGLEVVVPELSSEEAKAVTAILETTHKVISEHKSQGFKIPIESDEGTWVALT